MNAIPLNLDDPYFAGAGAVETILKDPRVTVYSMPPTGSVFDPSRAEKNYAFPAGTGNVRAKEFVVDNEEPFLADIFIPAAVSDKLNMITNPNLEHSVFKMPLPLVGLNGNQAIVKIKRTLQTGGIFAGAEEWWVIQDKTKTPLPAVKSPEGGSFTDDDRHLLHRIAQAVGVPVNA